MDDNKVNFGYKKVFKEDKYKLVKNVFDSVASKYDLMNDLMSLGIHRLWKKELINLILQYNHSDLLDVGGGTGDIAFGFLKGGGRKVYVTDINTNMLEKGKEKAINQGILNNIYWFCSNAENLPIKSETVSAYSISFCIRNVTDINAVLQEAYRVLKKGSRFYCLEFSKVENPIFSKIYDEWSFKVLPKLGEIVAKDAESYKYLAESIRKFPSQEEFKLMIKNAGFSDVNYKNLNNGIACIHTAIK